MSNRWKELTISLVMAGTLLRAFPVASQIETEVGSVDDPSRPIVVVSDLHMGVGTASPLEDFRWPHALNGFLKAVDAWGDGKVDLVIAGDLLELWQHPAVECQGGDADHGCTIDQMRQVITTVINAHPELQDLGKFASRNQNRLIIVPGNHDSALEVDGLWEMVRAAMKPGPNARIVRVTDKFWSSANGLIMVEHGHQIGFDVNRFDTWPIVTAEFQGQTRIVRSWGERWVQRLFNQTEAQYPLVDNLVPETAGARFYLQTHGLFGDASDLAHFLAFNLFETSPSQLGSLGKFKPGFAWDASAARSKGFRLFADAMPPEDGFRKALLTSPLPEWAVLRDRLGALAQDHSQLPEPVIQALCDQVAIQNKKYPKAGVTLCTNALGKSIAAGLLPLSTVLTQHLSGQDIPRHLQIFIFGHTHQPSFGTILPLTKTHAVQVLNTGAFQRLTTLEDLLVTSAKLHISEDNALATVPLEALKPCYTVVRITYQTPQKPVANLENWLMQEEAGSSGHFVGPCDSSCSKLASSCE